MKITKILIAIIIYFSCFISTVNAENITRTYDYDHIGRLTKADFGNTINMTYAYDPAGNITSIVEINPIKINSYITLNDMSAPFTINNGTYARIYGSTGVNRITLASGAKVECRNFVGENVITLEDSTSGFKVYRSGATVYFENSVTGTLLKIPATTTTQTLKFSDATLKLSVINNEVMLNDQVINLNSIAIGPLPSGDAISNFLGMTFVKIDPGTFMMGSPANEPGHNSWSPETQHQVTLTQGYYMQTTEVTQGQWEAIMGSNPSYFSSCGSDCPVENVSWDNAQEFINKLNQKGEGVYMLPTEAQWEYAARAGSITAFANGEITEPDGNDPNLDAMGWYYYNSSGTHPVAQKTPNAWGLYDMHGNVWEWCQDWYGGYNSEAVTDPEGPSTGSYRVDRGGSWSNIAQSCRSANRGYDSPGGGGYYLGFRLVLSPGQQ